MHKAQGLCGVCCKSSQVASVRCDLSPNGHNPADLVICDDEPPHLGFGVSITASSALCRPLLARGHAGHMPHVALVTAGWRTYMNNRRIAQQVVRGSKLTRRDLLRAGVGAMGAATLGMPGIARAQAKDIPFTLDFRIYGGNSPFYFGEESGINKELGFGLKIDGSPGSGEAIGRVASGSHAFGFADASTLVEFTARNPNEAPKMLLGIFDRFPACVLSFSKKPIDTLKDLDGARIGIGAASAATKVLPALLERANIDPKKVNWTTVDVKLRDSLLLRGAIDGVIGFDYTSIFNLIDAGAKMEDLHFLYFSEFGFSFPSNSLIASREMVEKRPDLCK